MPNYKEIEKLIAARKPFKHAHSMRAEVHDDAYRIYSYSTLIASFDFEKCEWWMNEKKYSVTTSKQQNLIRRAAGIAYSTKPQLEV
jgi:SAM-dependent MidA family methyltransferase